MNFNKRADHLIILLCTSIFAIAAIFRVNINEYSFKEVLQGTDDWNRYARNALDIKENGLLLKTLAGNYIVPAGFFYNYFIAACFFIFGNNIAVVYVIQSFLLGLTVFTTYFLFRTKMKPLTSYFFLVTLIIFGFSDFFKYYSFRLLSENLCVLTVILFFYFYSKTTRKPTLFLQFISGILLGMSILTRPNLLPFAIAFFLLIVIISKFKLTAIKYYWVMMLSCFLFVLLLPLRNFLVTHNFKLLPVDGTFFEYMARANPILFFEDPVHFFWYYLKKLVYCFGFLPVLDSAYNIRPHWIIMWSGYFIYLWTYSKKIITSFNLESVMHLFIFLFYLTLILIAPIQIYGFRMLLPCLLIVLGFSFIGFEIIFLKFYRNSKIDKIHHS